MSPRDWWTPLRRRVVIAPCAPDFIVNERIEIADGLRAVGGDVVPTVGTYERRAFAPVRRWRQADACEIVRVYAPGATSGERIDVVRAPFYLTDIIPALNCSPHSADALALACAQVELTARMERWAIDLAGSNIQHLGWWQNPPELDTVTRVRDELTGLHVDDDSRKPIGTRHRARRKLSLNLGEEDRYFLFLDQPIDCIHDDAGLPPSSSLYQLTLAFLEANMDAPVVALRVRPGEAYIAPVENIIHDGSTRGAKRADLTYVVMADFR